MSLITKTSVVSDEALQSLTNKLSQVTQSFLKLEEVNKNCNFEKVVELIHFVCYNQDPQDLFVQKMESLFRVVLSFKLEKLKCDIDKNLRARME